MGVLRELLLSIGKLSESEVEAELDAMAGEVELFRELLRRRKVVRAALRVPETENEEGAALRVHETSNSERAALRVPETVGTTAILEPETEVSEGAALRVGKKPLKRPSRSWSETAAGKPAASKSEGTIPEADAAEPGSASVPANECRIVSPGKKWFERPDNPAGKTAEEPEKHTPKAGGVQQEYRERVREAIRANGPQTQAWLIRKLGIPNGSITAVLRHEWFEKCEFGIDLKAQYR